jgi:hypothetical protein
VVTYLISTLWTGESALRVDHIGSAFLTEFQVSTPSCIAVTS